MDAVLGLFHANQARHGRILEQHAQGKETQRPFGQGPGRQAKPPAFTEEDGEDLMYLIDLDVEHLDPQPEVGEPTRDPPVYPSLVTVVNRWIIRYPVQARGEVTSVDAEFSGIHKPVRRSQRRRLQGQPAPTLHFPTSGQDGRVVGRGDRAEHGAPRFGRGPWLRLPPAPTISVHIDDGGAVPDLGGQERAAGSLVDDDGVSKSAGVVVEGEMPVRLTLVDVLQAFGEQGQPSNVTTALRLDVTCLGTIISAAKRMRRFRFR